MVAPPWFDIPPRAYGGIEAVVGDLTEVLVARGHTVTLIAAGRNGTPARFLRTYDEPPSQRLGQPLPEVVHAAAVARLLADLEVDVVHDHSLAGPLTAAGRQTPTVATIHGPTNGDLADYYRHVGTAVSLVAISEAQRGQAPDLNWRATVHNGIDVASFPYQESKEDWVLFIGRFDPDKGPDLAIDAARAAGRSIVLAGKLNEPAEHAYFEQAIRPRLGPDATYVGEADATLKRELYAKATCLMFPVRWSEPFGMVMTEAMACGTPVVALRRGSVPEVVAHGTTGIICTAPDELPAAIDKAASLRPA
ncbi:MAG TPA: glycosyltransferase family 4 protein, partial [Pilimelia sp.]|nr:glycosyltransferase family 4 protein [Pilimelia sp.]